MNQPGQARQTQELQEQFTRTLRGLRFTGVLPPQLHDQILSEFNKARKGGTVAFAKFQRWLQHSLAQISSGSDQAQQASLKDIHATLLKQARNANDALVRGMQMFSSRSDKTAASLRALQRQAQVDLKALRTERDRLQTLLARPEAASFPQEIHTSLKQVNGWITTAQSFCRRLEKEIASRIVSTGGSGARVTHTRRVGTTPEIEGKAREKNAQQLKEAVAWVFANRKSGLSLDELSKRASRNFFLTEAHAGAIAKAVAGGGGGVQGNKGGGVRASALPNGSTRAAGTANPDSGSPTERPALEELKERIASLPFSTEHLQVVRDEGSGRLSLTVDPNKLDLEPRKAHVVLLNKFGEAGLTQKLASLIMPSPGLARASSNLDAETQLQLAKVIFNEPTRETINDLGSRRADDSIGHSLGALVLLQMGLLPSSREVFTAMREAFGSLGTIRRSPFEIVRRYAPTNAELVRAAGNQSTSGRPELSHLAFAALVASMLAKPEIHNKMKRSKDRPPFFEIQSRLLQLLESELNRSSSAEQDNPVLDDNRLSIVWTRLSREQKLSVVADTQSRVFQLLESCGSRVSYLQDNQGNDMLKPEYILNAIGQYNEPGQLDQLITELRNRFKKFGENLPYHLVGEGAWNDNLISSLIRHALAQALALKRTDADGQGQPQPQPFKRWLDMSTEEQIRFLSDPTRAEQTRRWLALTAEQREAILKKVIHEAMNLPD